MIFRTIAPAVFR